MTKQDQRIIARDLQKEPRWPVCPNCGANVVPIRLSGNLVLPKQCDDCGLTFGEQT